MPENLLKTESTESTPRKPLDVWDKAARRVIKAEMAKTGHTPKSLAALMRVPEYAGYGTDTPKALAQRIARGSFTFGFALRLLHAMGLRSVDFSYLHPEPKKKTK